ncbi:MAG: aspartate carbamoyltransferase [Chlamydiia bacterium]|nr:aspartate carbamoyltransferase [Chlamydiia bacterium]
MSLLTPTKPKLNSLVSIDDLDKEAIERLLEEAEKPFEPDALKGKIVANLFFEPSTRTRLSFETAALRQGANVITVAEPSQTSLSKGESLHDTIKMVSSYSDLIVLRHPAEGAAKYAGEISDVPLINAGDGANEHPTQALLDLFAIKASQGTLEGLSLAIAGDLKYGRTIHSLLKALAPFSPRLYLICPEGLEPASHTLERLKEKRVLFSFHSSLKEVLPEVDVLYMTRVQKERIKGGLIHPICLKPDHLKQVKPNLKILHPMPRNQEIDPEIDKTPYAYYFEQAKGALNVRATLLRSMI